MKTIEKYKAGSYRNQGDFKSFLPSPINDQWVWSDTRLNNLLSTADKELGGLNTFSELVPDIDTYIRMHIQIEANKSNRIEGTNTSIEDDMMHIEDVDPERRDDAQEVNNYIAAMNHGIHRIVEDDFPFTSRLMREMHEILLRGVRGEHKTPGEFRTSQNFIGGTMPGNALYVPPAVIDMNELMGDLDKFINREEEIPALVQIAIIHYQFESIHPFLDGNGRIGRLSIPLFLLSKKELSKPCFYISDYFEQHRTEYYDALQRVRVSNNMLGWICFFLQASIQTSITAKQKFRNAIKQVDKYKAYLAQKRTSTESSAKIITAMYSRPVATVNDLVELTKLSAQTVNTTISVLCQDNIVKELTGNRRNRVFALYEYINVFK